MNGRVIRVVYDFRKKEITVTIECDVCIRRTRTTNTFPPTDRGNGMVQVQCGTCDVTAVARLPHPSEFGPEKGR